MSTDDMTEIASTDLLAHEIPTTLQSGDATADDLPVGDMTAAMRRKEKKREEFRRRFPGYRFCAPVDRLVLGTSRHDFGAPLKFQKPHPNDIVFAQTAKLVKEFNSNLSPIEAFANPVRLEALNAAPTTVPPYACESTTAVHILMKEGDFVKVQLKLSRDLLHGWESSIVMLKDEDRWYPLKNYLESWQAEGDRYVTGRSPVSTLGRTGYRVQYAWWKSMGKSFPFLNLPKELQEQILLFSLGTRIEPSHHDTSHGNQRLSLTKGTSNQKERRFDDLYYFPARVPPTNLSVLSLNKATHAIAQRLLREDTSKYFGGMVNLINLLPILPHGFGDNIRRLEMSFRPIELVESFEVQCQPFSDQDPQFRNTPTFSAARTHMPNLQHVEIFFVNTPRRHEHRIHAWEAFHSDNFLLPFNAWELDGMDFHRVPCSKVFTDWVMAFAADHLRDLRSVRLRGSIKDDMKSKWEKILNKMSGEDSIYEIEGLKQQARMAPCSALPPRCLPDFSCCPENQFLVDLTSW